MTYPIGVTKNLGTWKFQQNHVERMLDNATYDAAHPDDTLLLAGPARKGVAVPGTNAPRTLMALGMFQSFGIQSQAPVMPLMGIGSGRSFFLRGKSQSSWNLQRVMINGRNLLRALYHNAVEVSGLDASMFDDPAALRQQSQFFINLDSELFYIPFGLVVVMRTKSRTLVAGCYLELCMINSYGTQIQAGQNMIAEMVSGACDRILPFQATDYMSGVTTNGRATMDAVLGLANNIFPTIDTANVASFNDTEGSSTMYVNSAT
jgi:hypothetical protein